MFPFASRLRHAGRIALLGALVSWTAVGLALGLLSGLDHFDSFEPASWLYGLDFLAPLWLGIVLLPAAGAWALLGRRRFAVALAVFFLCYVLLFGDLTLRPLLVSTAQADAAEHAPLTVLAWNVKFYKAGMRPVVAELERSNADVWVLSESPLASRERARLEALTAPRAVLAGGRADVAIVTSLPVLAFQEVDFPTRQTRLGRPNSPRRIKRSPHRAFLHAVLERNGAPVHVIAVRLTAGRPPSSKRADQVAWARYLLNAQQQEMQALVAYLDTLDGPVIVGGDLNAPPRSKTLRPLRELASDARYANHLWGQRTFPAVLPWTRIDYLFGANGARPLTLRTLEHGPSDHLPILAAFDVEKRGLATAQAYSTAP